jgi:flagellar protein FliL
MSKTQPAPAEAAAEAKPKKGKKLIVIIAAAVLLLGGGGGGAWFFMKPKPNAKNAHAAKSEEHEKPPAFVDLDTFTVNLQPQSEGQFLQATLVAKLKEEAASEAIKARMPEIKDRVLMLLSSKSASDISSLKGKQQLGRDVTVQIKQAIGDKKHADQILGVLFTSFVIQ